MPPKRPPARLVDLTKAADEAKLDLQPVAVYISRAKQKLYVRRTTGKPWPDGGEVFDSSIEVPVTIRDPDRPIGTHIFTAMASTGAGLRWSAVTIDGGDNAQNALDRISIPQDVLNRIAATALPRSSIIVSDEPPSRETNYRTEFVAVLSNHPQGGFKTRKPTVNVCPNCKQQAMERRPQLFRLRLRRRVQLEAAKTGQDTARQQQEEVSTGVVLVSAGDCLLLPHTHHIPRLQTTLALP